MSQFRASQIYISANTRRLLRSVAKAESADTTVDEVGDRLLSEYITERYPGLVTLQKEVEQTEEKMLEYVKACQ
jgi:HEPN domain-containing protein